VSVGSEGAIFIWKMPKDVVDAKAEQELPTIQKPKSMSILTVDDAGKNLKK
jgi:hypothetical protein